MSGHSEHYTSTSLHHGHLLLEAPSISLVPDLWFTAHILIFSPIQIVDNYSWIMQCNEITMLCWTYYLWSYHKSSTVSHCFAKCEKYCILGPVTHTTLTKHCRNRYPAGLYEFPFDGAVGKSGLKACGSIFVPNWSHAECHTNTP